MNSHGSASAYHQGNALGATAVGQIITLCDTILRDIRAALSAIEAGHIEQRVNASNHALVVIGELQGVLDFKRGGEAARTLNSFYNVTRAMISHASVMSSREEFQELIKMYARIRAAWSHVERTVPPSAPSERLRISSERQPASPQNALDPAEILSEPGSGGGWKA
jgi:flagellar biosynthetic protein FliS